MTETVRPDLSRIPPDVLAYIEALEAELDNLRSDRQSTNTPARTEDEVAYTEPVTTISLITLSASNLIKRTYRHFYVRQHRGGMGVFDINLPSDDYPSHLCLIDEAQKLLAITNLARAYHIPVSKLPPQALRSSGIPLQERLDLQPGERVVVMIPNPTRGYLSLVSENGLLRRLRHHIFGDYLKPGQALFDLREFGQVVDVCASPGDEELLIITRLGNAIRFSEKLVPPQGCRGIRLQADDKPVAICSVNHDAEVFVLSKDGRGTIRKMSGFAPNKAPGSGGKTMMKADEIASAITVNQASDLFIISRLGKIIRFQASEIPPKDSVVQGVHCMALRSDECVAVASTSE
jgi:DNA gyrase subunit A